VSPIPQCQSCILSWKSTHVLFVNIDIFGSCCGIRRKETAHSALRERAKLELLWRTDIAMAYAVRELQLSLVCLAGCSRTMCGVSEFECRVSSSTPSPFPRGSFRFPDDRCSNSFRLLMPPHFTLSLLCSKRWPD